MGIDPRVPHREGMDATLPSNGRRTGALWVAASGAFLLVVAATDAPLTPDQLKRIARRVSLGMGRMGSNHGNGSGDIFIAFSTANPGAAAAAKSPVNLSMLPNDQLDSLFEATVQATEEAIVNSMVAAESMVGFGGRRADALSHERVRLLAMATRSRRHAP